MNICSQVPHPYLGPTALEGNGKWFNNIRFYVSQAHAGSFNPETDSLNIDLFLSEKIQFHFLYPYPSSSAFIIWMGTEGPFFIELCSRTKGETSNGLI